MDCGTSVRYNFMHLHLFSFIFAKFAKKKNKKKTKPTFLCIIDLICQNDPNHWPHLTSSEWFKIGHNIIKLINFVLLNCCH